MGFSVREALILLRFIYKNSPTALCMATRIGFVTRIIFLKLYYKNPPFILYWGPALGDYLLFTPSLDYLFRQYGRKIWVLTHYPEIYKHNPSVLSIPNNKDDVNFQILSLLKFKMVKTDYTQFINEDTQKSPESHIILEIAKSLNIQ